MNLSLIGRRVGKRIIRWRWVFARAVVVILAVILLFLLGSILVIVSADAPFSQMWWGNHLFVLLLSGLAVALLLCVVIPLLRRLFLPLDRLPDFDAPPGGAGVEGRSGWRLAWRGLLALVCFAVLVGLFYAEENWRGAHAWQRYKQQQEARGEHLESAALVPPAVPDDQNFASTPFLAPLFDFLPGTQRPRLANAFDRTKELAPRYDAASSLVKPGKVARSNSWVIAGIDLPAWHATFLAATNAAAGSKPGAHGPAIDLSPVGTESKRQLSTTNYQPSTSPPTRVEAATGVLAALAESEPVLEELRAASRRPHSRFNIRYDNDDPAAILLPHYAALKRVCQLLQLRSSAELALGHTEPAFDDINFMFRITDAIRDEPLLIGQLVRIAEFQIALQPLAEGLARHQWSEPQLRAFEQQLRQFDFCADGRYALEGERVFFGGSLIDYLRRSPNKCRALAGLDGGPDRNRESLLDLQSALMAAAPSGWFYFENLNYSRMFQDYFLPAIDVPGRRLSPDACRKTDERIWAMLHDPWPVLVLRHQFFCGWLLPSLTRGTQRTAFAQTAADAATLACALERYRLAHGQFPDSLDPLVPEFLSQLPHDVINGQPLKYRRTADGQYLLYSVGWNQTDDGGAIGLTKSGEGIDLKLGDWVWRLPAES